MKTISILGCGWLGFPLAQALLKQGHTVQGSTTRKEKLGKLHEAGVEPFLLQAGPELNEYDPSFFNCDLLVVDIPPDRRTYGDDYHPKQLTAILEAVKRGSCRKLIYISATSVYADGEGVRVEEDVRSAAEASNKALGIAEELIHQAGWLETCVLRLGGLMGYDRIPAKYAVGRKEIAGGSQPVNYIHRDDAVGAILKVLEEEPWGETFNVAAPEHPSRKAVYEASAKTAGYPMPDFHPQDTSVNKTVSPQKLIGQLGYQFQYPDPLRFAYDRKEP